LQIFGVDLMSRFFVFKLNLKECRVNIKKINGSPLFSQLVLFLTSFCSFAARKENEKL
jgi:hypothetical protein